MKTAPARSFPRPGYYPHLPSPRMPKRGVEIALAVTLLFALFTAAWFLTQSRQEVVPATPEARLELLLSGVVTSSLSVGADQLSVQCSPSGFQLTSTEGTAFPLTLAFNAPASANATFYVLGSKGDFALRLNGADYTLVSGTVTTTPGARTFNASFVDAQSQPLQLNGRLTCPYPSSSLTHISGRSS